jgi:hypothetical protein
MELVDYPPSASLQAAPAAPAAPAGVTGTAVAQQQQQQQQDILSRLFSANRRILSSVGIHRASWYPEEYVLPQATAVSKETNEINNFERVFDDYLSRESENNTMPTNEKHIYYIVRENMNRIKNNFIFSKFFDDDFVKNYLNSNTLEKKIWFLNNEIKKYDKKQKKGGKSRRKRTKRRKTKKVKYTK